MQLSSQSSLSDWLRLTFLSRSRQYLPASYLSGHCVGSPCLALLVPSDRRSPSPEYPQGFRCSFRRCNKAMRARAAGWQGMSERLSQPQGGDCCPCAKRTGARWRCAAAGEDRGCCCADGFVRRSCCGPRPAAVALCGSSLQGRCGGASACAYSSVRKRRMSGASSCRGRKSFPARGAAGGRIWCSLINNPDPGGACAGGILPTAEDAPRRS